MPHRNKLRHPARARFCAIASSALSRKIARMNFPGWQQLGPGEAAREIHARIRTRLAAPQQRAAIAVLAAENELATQFAGASSRRGPLAGVPFFAKDLFDVAGQPTFAGSTFLPEVRPTPARDSTLIRALRDAGAILAGKTHLHEFAYGITGENPHYGDCEHPHFPGRTTGGSSSGSAALVDAGIAPLALGTDTGGSVRLPAAFCGIYGFRLAPGSDWIADAFPLAPSFDTAGWFTQKAADMRATIAALIGSSPGEHAPRGCYLEPPGLDPEVALACRAAAQAFAPEAESAVRSDLLAGFLSAPATYNTLVALEAWQVHQSWAEKFRARYDPSVWQRLNRVHDLTTAQIDAAHADLAAVRQLWKTFFLTYDFLVLPASPFAALTKADCTLANRNRILALTTPASLGGLPVLTIPVFLPGGLSTGLQVVVDRVQSPALAFALTRGEKQPARVAA
jgi:amidase/aspartyl-tRNA(Asn)/glutamyl-tRNA(Gln) amidotransferase subunit A